MSGPGRGSAAVFLPDGSTMLAVSFFPATPLPAAADAAQYAARRLLPLAPPAPPP